MQPLMSPLIPTELWDYSAMDVFRGVGVTLAADSYDATVHLPGIGTCTPARSARAAIIVAIKALRLSPQAVVGVPLYCCPVVFKAVMAAGCKIRFIDVDPETFCMSSQDLCAKRAELHAVIAVHMFGNLCNIPNLQDVLQGKPVIEDCAQAFGSRLHGRLAGSFGNIAVFSFRSGKYLSVGEGGAIFSASEELRSRASQVLTAMPIPGRIEELLHVGKTYIRSKLRSRPLYGMVGERLWRTYGKRVGFLDQSPVVLGRIYRTDLATTIRRLGNVESSIEKQRANADYYARALRVPPEVICREMPGAYYNRFQFPLTFPDSEQRDYLSAYLHRRLIDTARPLNDIVEAARRYYNYAGDCPVAERLSKRTLIIPSNHSLAPNDIRRIADCVSRGWNELSRGAFPHRVFGSVL